MPDDVYSTEQQEKMHSLRFVHVTVLNTLGIVNRLTSLLRRKRYFIDDMSITFDENDFARIVLVMDMRLNDIAQVMRQIHKLHDVIDVYDMTDQTEKLYDVISVSVRDEADLKSLAHKPVRILSQDGGIVGIYMLTLEESRTLVAQLKRADIHFIKRLISLT